MKAFLFSIGFLACISAWAQEPTLEAEEVEPVLVTDSVFHSPKKASLLSAALPGLGQAYNKQYWKIPIVYAGLGTSIYFINDNTKNFKFFREQLLFEIDGDTNTVNTTGGTPAQLREVVNTYRSWRDWSYIATAAIYGLQILDANVSAHLFYFDVSDDLSLMWTPAMVGRHSAGVFLRLQF